MLFAPNRAGHRCGHLHRAGLEHQLLAHQNIGSGGQGFRSAPRQRRRDLAQVAATIGCLLTLVVGHAHARPVQRIQRGHRTKLKAHFA